MALPGEVPPQEPEVPQEAAPAQDDPKNKQIFDMIVANVQEFIHDPANSDRILQAMGSGEVAQVAGQQAAIILSGIVESAARNGIEPTADVAMSAAAVAVSEIVDLAVAAGVLEGEPTEDADFQNQAMEAFMQAAGQEQPAQEAPQEAPQEQPAPTPAQAPPGAGVLSRAGAA